MNTKDEGIIGIIEGKTRVIIIPGPATGSRTLTPIEAQFSFEKDSGELKLQCQSSGRCFTVPGRQKSIDLGPEDVFVVCSHTVKLDTPRYLNPDEKQRDRKWKMHCLPSKCKQKTEQAFFYVEGGIGTLRFTILDMPARSLTSTVEDYLAFPQLIQLTGAMAIQRCDGICPPIPQDF